MNTNGRVAKRKLNNGSENSDNVVIRNQLGAVNGVFTPTPEQVARARKVIAAYEASETGLVVLDGKLIEAPVIRAMRARMEAAEAAGVAPDQAEAGE